MDDNQSIGPVHRDITRMDDNQSIGPVHRDITRMDDNANAKTLTASALEECNRPPGHPRTTWIEES